MCFWQRPARLLLIFGCYAFKSRQPDAFLARSPRASSSIDVRMNGITRTFRQWSWPIADKAARLLHPRAQAFYTTLIEGGYDPNVLIDVLPDQRIVYVCVPKCASARIKNTLSALLGRYIQSSEEAYTRQQSGLRNPKGVGVSAFWRVATDPVRCAFHLFATRTLDLFRCGRINLEISRLSLACRRSIHISRHAVVLIHRFPRGLTT